MKIKDLRTGNWVMGNKPFQLTGNLIALYEAREDARKHNILRGNQLPKPIILNEEWLIKFGFVREGMLTMRLGEFTCYCEEDCIDNFCLRSIELFDVIPKYVHQLQNLYHALTGEELTIENNEED